MLDRSARIDGQQSYAEQECAVIEQESSELAGISYVGSNIDQKLEQHRLRFLRISNMNNGLIVLMPVITINSCFSVPGNKCFY